MNKNFSIRLHPDACKFLMKLERKNKKRLIAGIKKLAEKPRWRRSGADIKKLGGVHGKEELYRLRIGEHRVIYAVKKNIVWITEIMQRGKEYKPKL